MLKIGFPLYEKFDSLDVLGPFQAFYYAGYDCYLIGACSDEVKSLEGVTIRPRAGFDDAGQMDVLFVPGGSDIVSVFKLGPRGCNPYLNFLTEQARGAKLVCSVCTGALLLGAAGLLDGHTATTHWAYKEALKLFPCTVVDDYRRYVQSGNTITGAGISSGLDEALYIVSLLSDIGVARATQLKMQYNPQPFLNCGDPDARDIKDEPALPGEIQSQWGVPGTVEFIKGWLTKKSPGASRKATPAIAVPESKKRRG